MTPWTAAHQAPLSLGFSRQEHWSGLPCPPPGDLPNPGIEPPSPALLADSLCSEPPGKLKQELIIVMGGLLNLCPLCPLMARSAFGSGKPWGCTEAGSREPCLPAGQGREELGWGEPWKGFQPQQWPKQKQRELRKK